MDVVVEELDRLRIENAQLKLMALRTRQEQLLQELNHTQRATQEAVEAYTAILLELAKKYEFDPETHGMEATSGRIVPRGQT